MGPGQKNQKGCPEKPGMWLPSDLKAKTLTEKEAGPHLRQTTCSEWDMAQHCSQPLGPKVPPSYPWLRGRVLSKRLGSRRSVAWISQSNGKTKDYRTCAVKSTLKQWDSMKSTEIIMPCHFDWANCWRNVPTGTISCSVLFLTFFFHFLFLFLNWRICQACFLYINQIVWEVTFLWC